MIASMVRSARGFRVLGTAAMAALALTFTAGCNDPAPPPDNGNEQQQEDGGGDQEGGGEQEGGEDDD